MGWIPYVLGGDFDQRSVIALSRHQRGEAVEVDVAAGDDDADALAAHVDLAGQHRGGGEAAGRLDQHLHPAGEEAHGVDQLVVGDGVDVVDQPLHHREGQLADIAALGAIGDGLRRLDADDAAAAQALLGVVAGLRLDADHAAAGVQRLRRHRAAGQQPAAAGRHHQQIQRRATARQNLFDQFLGDSALPGHHMRVVEGRDEDAAPLLCHAGDGGIGRLGVAVVQHHLGAIAAGGGKLGRRGVHRHDDGRLHPQHRRRQGDGLGVVAGRIGDDADRALHRREAGDGVVGAAHLEGAGALEILALEQQLAAVQRVGGAAGQHRRAVGAAGDPLRRPGHVGIGDGEAGSVDPAIGHGAGDRVGHGGGAPPGCLIPDR